MHTPYDSTANKQRPQSFSELTGQDFVIHTLIGNLTTTCGAHAYLFSGPRGVGKTSAARLLALALNRPSGNDVSQLDYDGSNDIRAGRSLDVIEIDGASYTSVENIRSIREEIRYEPVQFSYKVYIIDEVHMLSNSAFNALLKTIEEPPEYVVFIFATTELHKVPTTIRSRCQQFAFKRIGIPNIVEKLSSLCKSQNRAVEDDALLWIAKEADGSMRDAYMLFDQVCSFSEESITLEGIKKHIGFIGTDMLNTLFVHCVKNEKKEALSFIASLYASGMSSEHLLLEASEYMRNILFIKAGISSPSFIGHGLSQFDSTVYETLTSTQIEYALSLLLECYRNIRYTANERFEVDLTFALLCRLAKHISQTQLVERLERLQKIGFPHASLQQKSQDITEHVTDKNTDSESRFRNTPKKDDTSDAWEKVITLLQKEDERLAVIVESANIQKKENTLTCIFFDAFAFSTFQKQEEKILNTIKKVYGTNFTLEAMLQEPPSYSTEKQKHTIKQTSQSKIKTDVSTNDKKQYSPNIESVLNIFGGSVKDNE